MKTSQKGSKAELEFKRILESRGYIVEKAKMGIMYGDKDFFNLFDLIALGFEDVLLVQVKCNSTRGAIKSLRNFRHHPKCCKKILAVRYDRGIYHPQKAVWREIIIEGEKNGTKRDSGDVGEEPEEDLSEQGIGDGDGSVEEFNPDMPKKAEGSKDAAFQQNQREECEDLQILAQKRDKQ